MLGLFLILAVMGVAATLANPRKIDIKQYSDAGCRNGYGMCSDISVVDCCKDQASTWAFASASMSPLQNLWRLECGNINLMNEYWYDTLLPLCFNRF